MTQYLLKRHKRKYSLLKITKLFKKKCKNLPLPITSCLAGDVMPGYCGAKEDNPVRTPPEEGAVITAPFRHILLHCSLV